MLTNQPPLDQDQVRTLLAAVDEGTFEAAARVLHVTPSAVSQRIKALEQHTGRVLLVRSKPVRPTESGLALVRYARQVAWLEHAARIELGLPGETGAGARSARERTFQTVAVAVNADSLSTWFLAALAEARAGLEPATGIRFELHREDQDHTDDLLRQGLVMAAVSSSPKPVQGCSVRALGRMRYRAAATAGFAREWGLLPGGGTVAGLAAALADAPVVIFNRKDDLQDGFLRGLGVPGSGPRHYVPASDAYAEAVARGLGWGMIPEAQFGPELVELAPDRPVDVPLYWQQWKLGSPALTAVGAAVAAAAGRVLRQ